MKTIQELEAMDQWEQLLESSKAKKVFLLKHSTTCPISTAANNAFQSFVEEYEGDDANFAFVKVRESRPISNAIAETFDVKHESPQFFIIENKEVKWCDSHWNITKKKIAEAI